jgi:hypothetical protein
MYDTDGEHTPPEDGVLAATTPLGKALDQRRKQSLDRTLELEQAALTAARPDMANEKMLIEKFEQPTIDLGYGSTKPLFMERDSVSWWRQLRILMERNVRARNGTPPTLRICPVVPCAHLVRPSASSVCQVKETLRRKSNMVIAIIQTVIMAVLIGTVFLQIGRSQSSATRRQPVLFFVCINQVRTRAGNALTYIVLAWTSGSPGVGCARSALPRHRAYVPSRAADSSAAVPLWRLCRVCSARWP